MESDTIIYMPLDNPNRFDRDEEQQPQRCTNCGGSGKAYVDSDLMIRCTCNRPAKPEPPKPFLLREDKDPRTSVRTFDLDLPLSISIESRVADLENSHHVLYWLFFALLVAFLILLSATAAKAQTVATELSAANDDCKTLPAAVAKYSRYITLYSIPPDERLAAVQSIGFVLNHISRSPVIVQSTRVNDTLVRFSVIEFAPDDKDLKEWSAAWEKLVDKEPYFHLQTEVANEAVKSAAAIVTPVNVSAGTLAAPTAAPVLGTGKPQQSGRNFSNAAAGTRPVVATVPEIPVVPVPALSTTVADSIPVKKTKIVTVDGGWIGLAKAAELEKLTYSKIPIVKAEWLIAVSSVPPFYYDFAGVDKDINVWLKKFGTSKVELFDSLSDNLLANIVRSGVTDKTRRAGEQKTRLGRIYWTIDNRDMAARKDVYRNPDQHVDFDATEIIARRKNGLHEFALYNDKGVRQDAVPPDIAIDFSVTPPVQLQPGLSCWRCHDVIVPSVKNTLGYGTNGILELNDKQSSLLSSKPDSRTKAAKGRLDFDNPKTAADLAASYSDQPQLAAEIAREREDYAKAVGKATGGLSPAAAVKNVAKLVADYQKLVTAQQACVELGLEPTDPKLAAATLRKRFDGTHDPILILLAQDEPVQRPQWEASWQEANLLSESNRPAAVNGVMEEIKKLEAEKRDEK